MTANAMAKARRHVVRPDARSAPSIFRMVRALATIAHIAGITFPVLRRARSLAHNNFGGL